MTPGISLSNAQAPQDGTGGFALSLTGLVSGAARPGTHAAIGYAMDPDTGTGTASWGSAPGDDSYGTGPSPSDFAGGDGGSLWLTVTDAGETRALSAPIRHAPGTAPDIADGQAWIVDDTEVDLDAAATGAGLVFVHTATGLPAGVSIDPATGRVTGTPEAASGGTATLTATDQYGRTLQESFTWTAALRPPASAAGALPDRDWIVDDDIVSLDLSGDFAANGNTLGFAVGGLPTGLLDGGDGMISGTPRVNGQGGTVTVTATDEYGRQVQSTFGCTTAWRAQATLAAGLGPFAFLEGAAILAEDLATGFAANGNTLSFAMLAPLPPGLALSASGSMTGTPTQPSAPADYTLRATDEYGRTTDATFTLGIAAAGVAPAIGGVPVVTGAEQVGATLTAAAAPATGSPVPSRGWQWRRAGAPIAGATGASHTLGPADAGATLTVVQTETNALGTASAESAPTGPIAAAPAGFAPASLFANGETGLAVAFGPGTAFTDTARATAASVGSAIAAVTDLAGTGNHPAQATAAARPILRQAANGRTYAEFDGVNDALDFASAIAGAAPHTAIMAVRVNEAGRDLFGFGNNAAGQRRSYTSQVLFGVFGANEVYGPDLNGSTVVLTTIFPAGGAQVQDHILRIDGVERALTSTLGPTSPVSTAGAAGFIGRQHATSSSHGRIDVFGFLLVDRELTAAELADAEAWAAELAGLSGSAPAFAVPPADSLAGRTLTVTTGTVTGAPAPVLSIAMALDGQPVSPAGSGPWAHAVPSSGAAQTLAWTVTAENALGSTQSGGSETIPADLFAPAISGLPAIGGTEQVGQTLTATPAAASGTPAPVRTWQWRRNGTAIAGATGPTHTLVSADAGATLTVVQTETNALGQAGAESPATGTIAGALQDGIAMPGPVILVSATAGAISGTLPPDPAVVNRTINDRVVALVPLAAYAGNEQDPVAWTAGGAVYSAFQAAQATVTFTGSFAGDYVLVWEARDTTTTPRTDSDWSAGTAANVSVPSDPPTADGATLGAQDANGDVPVSVLNITEDAPDSYFVFTVSANSPTTAQVVAGQDHTGTPAPEAGTVSITQAAPNPTITGLALPSGTWHLHLVLGDAEGDRSAPIHAGPVVLDFTAPVLSGLTAVQTGASTATASVTSDEAGGTIFFGVRPSAAAALTAAQLIAGAGGAGVAWASDTTVAANGTNGATFSGLTAGTAYRVDAVQRDGRGNVSAVVSSAAFTTAAGASATTTFLASRADLTWATAHSFGNATHPAIPADLAGRRFVVCVVTRDTSALPSSVVIGGTTATLRHSAEPWNHVAVYDAVAGTANDSIVVNLPAPEYCFVSIYETTGTYRGGASDQTTGEAAPSTMALATDTTAGWAAVGCAAPHAQTGISYAGLAQRGATFNIGGRFQVFFDDLAVAGGSPEPFGMTLSGGGTVYNAAVLAVYG
jgi:hypothetical protein